MSNSSIQWRLANDFGIWMGNGWNQNFPETAADAWNSGHVNDILVFDGRGLVVATDAGGVWLIPVDGSLPQCLTDFLPHSTFNSLALGVADPARQIYAGGVGLYITDLSSPDPLFNWIRIPLPNDPVRVRRVLVLADRIVLACDIGMLWSPLPPPSSLAYTWMKAQVAGVTEPNFFDVAAGVQTLTQTPHGMTFSPEISAGGAGGSCAGLFWGHWDNDGVLRLARAPLLLTDIGRADSLEDDMAAVSAASCDSDRRYAYAVCARPWPGDSPHLFAVVRSNDGGRSWAEVGKAVEMDTPLTLAELAGHQGNYNNCVAVSRWDPDIVAFGFNNTFVSFNRGESWQPMGIDYGPPRHLHPDIHGLTFTDTFPGAPQDLLVASDGGVAAIRWGASPWLIESDHRSDGVHGDFEVLVLKGNTMMHYTRRSDDLGTGFKISSKAKVEAPDFPNRATGGGCMIVSDYATNGRSDYDAVVLEGNQLVHYWADNSTSPTTWHKAQVISTQATGSGCIIQSDFVTSGHSHFEVVVQEGSNLVHYWHEGSDRTGRWHRTPTPITTHAASAGCLIQSDFGSGGHGNFELVVLENSFGKAGAGIVHYWRDNSGLPYDWHGPAMIDRNATSQGCLFRSDYGSGEHANFELVVQTGRELVHWYRDNSAFPYPWIFARTILGPGPENKATGPGCAFQGSYLFNRFNSDHGSFELAACVDGKVIHYYVDYAEPPLTGWIFGGLISNQAHTFRSFGNRHLSILEFYAPATSAYTDPPGMGYSTLGVSSLVPGLIGSGLQDNGVLYATGDPGNVTPWFRIQGGDGGATAFLATRTPFENLPASGHVFIEFNNEEEKPKDPSGVRGSSWDSLKARLIPQPTGKNVIPLRTVNPKASPTPVPANGLLAIRMEAVTEPEYPRDPERLRRG